MKKAKTFVLAAMMALAVSTAHAQDFTGALVRMALNAGTKLVDRAVSTAKDSSTAKKATPEDAASAPPSKPAGDDLVSGAQVQAGADAADNPPAPPGVPQEVHQRLLALSGANAGLSAEGAKLKVQAAAAMASSVESERPKSAASPAAGALGFLARIVAPKLLPKAVVPPRGAVNAIAMAGVMSTSQTSAPKTAAAEAMKAASEGVSGAAQVNTQGSGASEASGSGADGAQGRSGQGAE